jgi:hypothetical protein
MTAPPSLASPAVQDNETLKALEIANIRLKAAEEREKLLNERIAAKDEIIRAKDGTIAVRDEQLALVRSANTDRRAIDDSQRERLMDAKEQLAKADARIHQLEHPGFLRSLFDTRTAYGAIAGYGLCKASSSSIFTR